MKNTIGQFDYRIHKMNKGDKMPFSPIVEVVLQHWSTSGHEAPIVSPHLMSELEIDEHIQNLKNDLDAVGKNAKKALQGAKERTMEIVSARVAARNDA